MTAGRPKQADAGALYAFAHQFYWDFRRIAEGHSRWQYDDEEHKRVLAEIEQVGIDLNTNQKKAIAFAVRGEIETGRTDKSDRTVRLKALRLNNIEVQRDWLYRETAEVTRKQIRIPGDPATISALLAASTPQDVRYICDEKLRPWRTESQPGQITGVVIPNWLISPGSVLPGYLSQYAAEFIQAKNDKRYPSSDRPTSQLKQLWFLSRALAGALYGVSVRTAINLVGSQRPEEVFEGSRSGKPRRNV